MCNYCAKHKEARRDESIHRVAGFGNGRERTYRIETVPLVTLRPQDVPAELEMLRQALRDSDKLDGGDE